ncbi:unnamed protein product [Adineta ricciae]|uniref:MADS-box domain-containing protein n=1 Tax=Adineta ricciae TaxID=249248 RepID=A0A815SRT1_ADIRI|nr:unnamed protein product [Adineta ricciae]
MSSSCSHFQESNSEARRQSMSSIESDDEEDEFINDDDSNDPSLESTEKTPAARNKTKKTLGRVKIKMAYIDNKIRRYTTFSKRKTGIMKKAYELATLTGTEVMLLVASETGHVYTYATAKLQPMITSEAGKALIQTCLAKDEQPAEPIVDIPTTAAAAVATTTLNNNDVIFIDENQRKKRTNISIDLHQIAQSTNSSTNHRPIKRARLKPVDDVSPLPTQPKLSETTSSHHFPTIPQPTTLTLPYYVHSDSQQATSSIPSSYSIDLNNLKTTGMNIIFTPTTTESSNPSNSPLVLTLGNFPYQPT